MIVLEQKNSNIGNEDNFKQRKFNKTIILKYKSLAVKQFFLFPSIILFQRFWFYLSLFAFRSIPPFPINCTRRRGGKVKLNVSTKLGKRFPHEERARAHYPSTLREQAEYEAASFMAHDKLQKEIDRDWTRFWISRRDTRVIHRHTMTSQNVQRVWRRFR